jgi:6-phosphofructokinase 1
MAAADRRSPIDAAEARACGTEAVRRALLGETGVMVTIERTGDRPYTVTYGTAPLADVAIRARPMPPELLRPGYVTPAFLDYLRPLVGEFAIWADLAELPAVATMPGVTE